MSYPQPPPTSTQPWHSLLAPLPHEAILCRKPVAPPEVLATPEGAAIAGWEQLTIELSAGAAGLRHILVVLDASGQPISAGDTVLYCIEKWRTDPAADAQQTPQRYVEILQESIGGRIEPDGAFNGTRWRTVGIETDEEEPQLESTPSVPSATDVAAMKALVAEVIRRSPSA